MLSSRYLHANGRILLQCKHGHEWEASLTNVKNRNAWCPHCSKDKRKLSIDLAHRLAAERGGKMLSPEYVNAQCKLLWQCEHGHQWEALLKIIKNQNTWCPRCSRDKRKLSIMWHIDLRRSEAAKCCLRNTLTLCVSFCGNASMGTSGRHH